MDLPTFLTWSEPPYWKKVTSSRKRDVVAVLSAHGQEGRGVESGEGAEIVDEVRLIEIAAGLGDRGPRDTAAAVDMRQDVLKTPNAAEEFRREPDLGAECLDKSAPTEADAVGDLANTSHGRSRKELTQRDIHCWMAR